MENGFAIIPSLFGEEKRGKRQFFPQWIRSAFLLVMAFCCIKTILFCLDRSLLRVVIFTLVQALFSAALSVILGLILAPTLSKIRFSLWGRLCQNVLQLPYYMPSIVVALALVFLLGSQGCFSKLFRAVGFSYPSFLFGMQGIVLSHLFYFLPFVLTLFTDLFSLLPKEHGQLAALLDVKRAARFRYLLWPLIKKEAGLVFTLVFIYCLRSFTLILFFGGGPKTTTIEVAIYQALYLDWNYSAAFRLTVIYVAMNTVAYGVMQRLRNEREEGSRVLRDCMPQPLTRCDWLLLAFSFLFLFFPLCLLLFQGLCSFSLLSFALLKKIAEAICYSLFIGTGVGLLSCCFAFFLIWMTYSASKKNALFSLPFELMADFLLLFSPSLVSMGIFSLFSLWDGSNFAMAFFSLLVQALLILPSSYRLLYRPFFLLRRRYDALCRLFPLSFVSRFRQIDWPFLRPVFFSAFLTGSLFSIGNTSTAFFFNTGKMTTLPLLIYDAMHRHAFREASLIACFLVLICLGLFLVTKALSPLCEK